MLIRVTMHRFRGHCEKQEEAAGPGDSGATDDAKMLFVQGCMAK